MHVQKHEHTCSLSVFSLPLYSSEILRTSRYISTAWAQFSLMMWIPASPITCIQHYNSMMCISSCQIQLSPQLIFQLVVFELFHVVFLQTHSFLLQTVTFDSILEFTAGFLHLSQLHQSTIRHHFQDVCWTFSASMLVQQSGIIHAFNLYEFNHMCPPHTCMRMHTKRQRKIQMYIAWANLHTVPLSEHKPRVNVNNDSDSEKDYSSEWPE